mmetsp:Transcript_36621/g.64505  ORF Transcript_36621/g.64505 Transcript_36621/m.64505 type:complete len:208 (+) Transcript_36621:1793-2416(+)
MMPASSTDLSISTTSFSLKALSASLKGSASSFSLVIVPSATSINCSSSLRSFLAFSMASCRFFSSSTLRSSSSFLFASICWHLCSPSCLPFSASSFTLSDWAPVLLSSFASASSNSVFDASNVSGVHVRTFWMALLTTSVARCSSCCLLMFCIFVCCSSIRFLFASSSFFLFSSIALLFSSIAFLLPSSCCWPPHQEFCCCFFIMSC